MNCIYCINKYSNYKSRYKYEIKIKSNNYFYMYCIYCCFQPSSIMLSVCLCISLFLLAANAATVPQALHFVGVGYNLIRGNPDGDFWARGGDDPGLLSTRKVLKLTASSGVPNEVIYEHHDACRKAHEFTFFHDPQSYQTELMERIMTSGNYEREE